MSMFTDSTCGEQGINACDTDLAGTWETPKGRSGGEPEGEDDCGSHFDLERNHRKV